MILTLALGKWRQRKVDLCESQDSHGYITRPDLKQMQWPYYATVILEALTQATSTNNTVSQAYEKIDLGKLVNNVNKKQCRQQNKNSVTFRRGSEI